MRRLYVGRRMPPTTVARIVGDGCASADVVALAVARGWAAERVMKYRRWTVAEKAEVKRLYLVEELTPEVIARRVDTEVRRISRLVHAQGWARELGRAVHRERRCERLAGMTERAAEGRRARWGLRPWVMPAPSPPPPKPPPVSADLRAQIDAAVAAGKVTVLPARHAAGLSAAEGLFWAAGVPGAKWGGR